MKTGFYPAKILLPKAVDMKKWSVIACDQFTSEKKYWEELKSFVGDAKSTLNLILPEIYLSGDTEESIKKINGNITEYLESGVFSETEKGYILTVRKTPYSPRRIGIVACVDLEEYDYKKGEKPLVRATEATIEERIPPRLKIRENAKIEFPHIMILFDDEKREIAEELYKNRDKYRKVYDFELNMNGGAVQGYFIPESENLSAKFSALLESERLIKKYGTDDKFAFAVGDGNHSLATAKAHWNRIKENLSEEERKIHPARYALAEFVNIYDEGIRFEPIFRFVSGVDRKKFINGLNVCGHYRVDTGDGVTEVRGNSPLPTVIAEIDGYIKRYIAENGGTVDYVHGEKNLNDLIKADKNSLGILPDALDKSDLFRYVSEKGAFPKKTFSMGEGVEKRYYLEGKKII